MAFCFGFAGALTAHGHNLLENNALLANLCCIGCKHNHHHHHHHHDHHFNKIYASINSSGAHPPIGVWAPSDLGGGGFLAQNGGGCNQDANADVLICITM